VRSTTGTDTGQLGQQLGSTLSELAGDEVDVEIYPEEEKGSAVELPAFSHLRMSIRMAQSIRKVRSGTLRSVKPRRGSVDTINEFGRNGRTPLVFHIMSGEAAMVDWAMDSGADAEVECYGKSPLLHAVDAGRWDMVNIMWDYQPTLNLEAKDTTGKTALAIAALQGNEQMIDTLVNLGSNVEATTQNCETPLMLAAQSGDLDSVKTLMRNNANCFATDKDGWSTLHHAVHGPDRLSVQDIIQHLIVIGVDVNCRSSVEETPLHKATMDRKTFAFSTLLQNNADWSLRMGGRRDCLTIAVQEEHTNIVAKLVHEGAVWEGQIPRGTHPKIKALLKQSRADMPPPTRKFSGDSAISIPDSVRSNRSFWPS
jgi:ankyrin repeat protein